MEAKRPRRAKRRPTVPILRQFGARVRQLRNERRWSLERFARESRLHWTYLGGIERGERNVSLVNIERIARSLEVPIAALFEESGASEGPRKRSGK